MPKIINEIKPVNEIYKYNLSKKLHDSLVGLVRFFNNLTS